MNPLLCGKNVVPDTINHDLNNLTKPGIYTLIDTLSEISNNPGIKYGMVVVFVANYTYTVQLVFDAFKSKFRFINTQQSQYNPWIDL